MIKKVYFVRHGQSVGNVDGIFHTPDVPLTKHGEDQARFVAKRCASLNFDVIISSTMQRARQTAGFICDLTGKPLEFTDDLVERLEPTRLLGKHESEPEAALLHQQWTDSYFASGVRAEDGENFDDMKARAERILDHLYKRGEQNIVAVTHGFFLRMLIASISFGKTLTAEQFKGILLAFRTTNTGMTVIQTTPGDVWHPWMEDRRWVIRAWNDFAHLGDQVVVH